MTTTITETATDERDTHLVQRMAAALSFYRRDWTGSEADCATAVAAFRSWTGRGVLRTHIADALRRSTPLHGREDEVVDTLFSLLAEDLHALHQKEIHR